MANEDPEAQWEPPTEAEMKIIQARRDRQDKISSITGEYLLKGYKMLDSICDLCGTILLQDKKGKNYCVACSEVDTDEHMKDDPALSNSAARRQAEELLFSSDAAAGPSTVTSAGDSTMLCNIPVRNDPSASKIITTKHCNSTLFLSPLESCENNSQSYYIESSVALKEKISWVTKQLKSCHNLNRSIQLCNLLKSCAEALLALKQLENQCQNQVPSCRSTEQRKHGK